MTQSEKKATVEVARELLVSAIQTSRVKGAKEAIYEVSDALDAAERRGFERAKRMVLNSWPSYILYEERSAIENLKYEEPMSDKPEGKRKEEVTPKLYGFQVLYDHDGAVRIWIEDELGTQMRFLDWRELAIVVREGMKHL